MRLCFLLVSFPVKYCSTSFGLIGELTAWLGVCVDVSAGVKVCADHLIFEGASNMREDLEFCQWFQVGRGSGTGFGLILWFSVLELRTMDEASRIFGKCVEILCFLFC